MPAGDRSDEKPGGSEARTRPAASRQVDEPRASGPAKRASNPSVGRGSASAAASSARASSAGSSSVRGTRPPRPNAARARQPEPDFDLDLVDEAGLPMWLSQAIATPFDSTGQPAAGAAPAGAAPAGAAPAGAANASARPSPSPSIVGRESHAANVASSPQPAAREPQPNAASVADLVGPASAPIEVTESVALAPTTVVPLVVTPPHALDALALTAATPVVASDEPTSATTDPATAAVRTTINARSRRPRVRKVRRVVRSVDAWSVFKVSLIFYALVYVVVLVAGVLLWNLAISTGTVANIEGLVKELFGLDKFTIDGAQLYRASWALGAFLAIGGTGLNVVAAVLFNLITDLVGGVRLTVLEEEVRADLPRRRRFRKAGTPDSVDGAASGSGIVSPP